MQNALGAQDSIILDDSVMQINAGSIAEQVVAQELLACANPYADKKLHFWAREARGSHAEIDFLKAYKANPYHMHVLNNLGTIFGNRGDYEQAIKYYKEAVRISPQFWDAVLNLSASYFNLQQTDSAYAILRQVPRDNDNANYENIVHALVYQKVENLKKTVDDRDVEMTLTRIRNSNDWMVKVHEQSIHDKVPLQKHLILESIYMLETVDSTINAERADYLRKKYISK